MPSRADVRRAPGWRVGLESALRALSVALLLLLLWRALHPRGATARTETARSATLERALAAWTRQPPAHAVVTLDSVPPPASRAWLAALRRAGVTLAWRDSIAVPTAVAVTALPDPAGAWEIDAAAPAGARLALRDALGAFDSLTVRSTNVALVVPRIDRGVTVRSAGGSAGVPALDSLVLRRILVEGAVGWETRFTVAALQERGWTVDALEHVAPTVDVRVGAPVSPDTARYAAAVAIDTSARLIAGGASAFVRSGGGLVTLHDAASIGPAGSGAVVLERRPDGDVRAARYGAGRVLRIGIPELWRMRMSTADSVADPVVQHRSWLARAVASVAYAPRIAIDSPWPDDPAPYADLVARIGPASESPPAAPAATALAGVSDALLATLVALSLLAEWLSRRLRGAR